MTTRIAVAIVLITVLMASCMPAANDVPTQTPLPTSTLTPVVPTPTIRSTPTPPPTVTPIPFPSSVTLKLDGNLIDTTASNVSNVVISQRAISVIYNEVLKRGYDAGAITVNLATTRDIFLSTYMEAHQSAGFPLSERQARENVENGLDGEAAGGFLVLFIGGENWKRSVPDRYTQISHEFFHTIQMGLSSKSGFDDENKPGPIWLLEGSASYFASAIDCKYRLTSTWYGWDWNSAEQMFPTVKLSDTVNRGYSDESPYVLGIAATALLVSNFGEDKIYDYFYLNSKTGWKNAFEETFGLTINEFYSQFEDSRPDLKKLPIQPCSLKQP